MARAIWTGSIGFGLVSIPVRLYPATSPKDVRFREVDRRSGRHVRRRHVVVEEPPLPEPREEWEPPAPGPVSTPGESRSVERDEIVKAFEVEPGRVVELEREEIEARRPERSRVIDIERFVELSEIDPVYFEKSYHLAPADESAFRPYALLRAVMERTGRVAIGRFVLRTKEHLVAVRPTLGILGLETLYFADEVHEPAPSWIAAQKRGPSPREIELSEALVGALAGEWTPSEFEDRDRRRLMELIASKDPREAVPEEPVRQGVAVQDLMEALRASVEQARGAMPRPRRRVGRSAESEG